MKNVSFFFLLSFFIEGVFGESVSVTDADSLTLHTGLTEIKEDDVLEWRFGAGHDRVARVRKASNPTIYNDVLDGRFRGRLKPDGQTGDLTITNIASEHAGSYEISINTIAIISFDVIVVSADPVKTVSVMEGDSLTLTGVAEKLRYEVIQWRLEHENSSLAKINRKAGIFFTHDGTDGRFRDRLKLDYSTGSLTIRNITTKHSGLYEVDISSSKHTIHKSFTVTVTVSGERKSVLSVGNGRPVTLDTALTEIQKDDSIQWMFEDTRIAEIYKADNFSLNDDERFRDRLKLDHQTGSLTITDTTFTDSGLYNLKIIRSRRTIDKRFKVTVTGSGLSAGAVVGIVVALLVFGAVAAVIYHRRQTAELKRRWLRMLSVTEGASVPLIPLFRGIEILKDDHIQWRFGGALIAERGADGKITLHDGMFNGRLDLENVIGSLTIKDTKPTDSGPYELRIIRSEHESLNTFTVSVFAKTDVTKIEMVNEGDSVTLTSEVTGIEREHQILWKFGIEDSLIAQIKEGTTEIFPFAAGWRFICRLRLDQNGSLTIKKIRPKDAGDYYLYITNRGNNSIKLFRVEVFNRKDIEKNTEKMSLKDLTEL